MRQPVRRINGKSLLFTAAVLAVIFLVEFGLAFALDGFSGASSGGGRSSKAEAATAEMVSEYEEMGIHLDPCAVAGMIDPSEKTGEKKAEGVIAYKINPKPVFRDSQSEGDLMIENHGDNRHLIRVRLELEDGEEIYTSGYLAPDMHIPSAPLDTDLEAGTYTVYVFVDAYDDDENLIGTLSHKSGGEEPITIQLTVKK